MKREELEEIVHQGESGRVEFKKSTATLNRVGETLCGFLNGHGGQVFIGITPDGQIVGQQVSDNTQREVAAMLSRFEPAAPVSIHRIPVSGGNEILVLEASAAPERVPFIFEGKPYQRIGSTTSIMPQSHYETLLLERASPHSRWETAPANGYDIDQLDREEILRTVRLGIEEGRLPESIGQNIPDILDRLDLRRSGKILNATMVLFGTRLGIDYPQCHLRLARFRGVDKSEFMDEFQTGGHAFALLEQAMAFLGRHLPVSGRIVSDRLERINEPLFPPVALREAIVNGLCHRDYSIIGASVDVAVFEDRVEIWSDGRLPFGLRPSDLKRKHKSLRRNPIITDIFFRRGLIEQWGRGTQKIVELCRKAGHPDPDFQEIAGSVVVTFRPASGSITTHVTPQVTPHVAPQVTAEVARLLPICAEPQTREALQERLGLRDRKSFQKAYLAPALAEGLIEMTIPGKPRSRLQKYRLTAKGRAWAAQTKP